ncbi:MAG TPA: hypothetical protein VJT81_09875 [Burkholderiales bacterium]|nr:hypothetical protein [Burkholderiales bacterium]
MLKKLWADPVWSAVIAGVILAAVAGIGSYFLDWWPGIGKLLQKGYDFSLLSTSVPNWLLGLLALLSVPAVLIAGVVIWVKVSPQKEVGPDWHSYTEDEYFGLRWRWRYGSDGDIYDLCTFCPHCDYQIGAQDARAYSVVDRVRFHCDSCGRHLGEFDESPLSLESKVKRSVQQKLRNGTWANRI